MKTESIAIGLLKPAPYNPRVDVKPGTKLHTDLKRSLDRFGMVQPIIWNNRTGHIVGGHQRKTILEGEGATHVDCVVVDLELEAEKELNVILNKVGEGNWHADKLGELLGEMKHLDLEALGFTKKELSDIFTKHKARHRNDPDANIPVPKTPRSKLGDLFTLISADGHPQHRVLCGDATDIQTVQTLIGKASPRLVFTDPPYGVGYVSQSKRGGKMKKKEIENDELRDTLLTEFLTKLFANAHTVTHGEAAMYTFYASRTHVPFEQALRASRWEPRQQLIWKKQMNLGRSHYHWSHEPCFYAGKQGAKVEWFGTRSERTVLDDVPAFEAMDKKELVALLVALRDQSTVWEIARDATGDYVHPTQKPIALAQRAIANNTLKDDTVIDPCGGSGSTMIACEELGRSSFTCEFDPCFVDAIVARYATVYEDVAILRNGKEQDIEKWRLPI